MEHPVIMSAVIYAAIGFVFGLASYVYVDNRDYRFKPMPGIETGGIFVLSILLWPVIAFYLIANMGYWLRKPLRSFFSWPRYVNLVLQSGYRALLDRRNPLPKAKIAKAAK